MDLTASFRRKCCFLISSSLGISSAKQLTNFPHELQCGQDSWLQYNHHFGVDMSTLPFRRSSGCSLWIHIRTFPRAYLAYYRWSCHSHRRIRDCCIDSEHCGTLRRMLHLPHRCLFSQLGHHWLGFVNPISDPRETSCKFSSPEPEPDF